ncbi:MAG: CRISPR-associated endonuclease Cas2 [Candidatus Aenigmatarchaeota archaeon]
MRLIVFFDLPVKSKRDRKAYQDFRNFLLKDGYDMVQFSVYSRICGGLDRTETHLSRLKKNLPSKGHVRCMIVTEKQYASMMVLLGEKTAQEKSLEIGQLPFGDVIF